MRPKFETHKILRLFISALLAWEFCPSHVSYSQTPPLSIREHLTFTEIDPGIEYGKVSIGKATKDETTGPWFVNALRIDLNRASIRIVHALDEGVGLETVSSLATRYQAAAAINGGYFRTTGVYRGEPLGLLVLNRKLLSEPRNDRVEFGLIGSNERNDIVLGHLKFKGEIQIGRTKHVVDGVNRPGTKDELLVYTPDFHHTTLTSPEGTEVVVQRNRIRTVISGRGSSVIPADGFVMWGAGKSEDWLKTFARKGSRAMFSWSLSPMEVGTEANWKRAYSILGGGPQLVKEGKVYIPNVAEKITDAFVNEGHPRTALARLASGKILLVTVDGRQRGESIGMSLPMLANLLVELGAVEAMNLDGGGSTTMVVHNKLVNKPSDETGERPVSDAILVFPEASGRRPTGHYKPR